MELLTYSQKNVLLCELVVGVGYGGYPAYGYGGFGYPGYGYGYGGGYGRGN